MQITVKARIPLECYTLQKEEVQDVKYIHHQELLAKYEARDDQFCVADLDGGVRLLLNHGWPVAERLCALMDIDLPSKTRLLCTLHARCCHLIDTVNEHVMLQTVGALIPCSTSLSRLKPLNAQPTVNTRADRLSCVGHGRAPLTPGLCYLQAC